jgi:hypothetical protein
MSSRPCRSRAARRSVTNWRAASRASPCARRTDAPSASALPKRSRISSRVCGRSSDWFSCWPWISSSRSPSSFSAGKEIGRPLACARPRLARGIVRETTSSTGRSGDTASPSSKTIPKSCASVSARLESLIKKRAETSACAAPARTMLGSPRAPSRNPSASTSRLFPAPVSPVNALSPPASSICALSIRRRLWMRSSASMFENCSDYCENRCPLGSPLFKGGRTITSPAIRSPPVRPS